MNLTPFAWFVIAAISNLVGSILLVTQIIVTKSQALKIGVTKWASSDDSENLKLPLVQNLLNQSRYAVFGTAFLILGSFFSVYSEYISPHEIDKLQPSSGWNVSAEDLTFIVDQQDKLRERYDKCVTQGNAESLTRGTLNEDLVLTIEACKVSVRADHEYEILLRKYGEEGAPSFLEL